MNSIARLVSILLVIGSNAWAQPTTTKPNLINMMVTPCAANALVIGNGATAAPLCGPILPASVATALAINVGTVGSFVVNGGAGGTPSAIVLTNATGTASGLTAGNVTTNANLTGAVTSIGNATTIAPLATNTVLGNATSGSASPTALPVGTCSTSASALKWTTNTGFGCNTAINAAQLGGATFAAPGAIGSGTPSTGAFTTLGSGADTITSASATALTVGLNGATNPAFQVDSSTASQAAGVKITGAATGGQVTLSLIDSGTGGYLKLAGASTSTITLGIAADHSNYYDSDTHSFRGNGGAGQLAVLNSTSLAVSSSISMTGNIQSKGTVPVGTTGSCIASSFVGGATAGKFSSAVCAAGTVILSSLPTAPNGYTCNAQDQTTTATGLFQQTASTTTSATFKATATAADSVAFQCTAW